MAQYALMSIEDLRSRGSDELARMLKASEQEKLRITAEHSRTMKDINRKIQTYVTEIRNLHEQNQKLSSENRELEELCCFLDRGRQKEQRAIQEWQKFGRYTTDVMQSDVKTFNDKFGFLESRLDVLMKENIDLKELCLLLAEDKSLLSDQDGLFDRVAGDGSSSSSPPNEKVSVHSVANRSNAGDDTSQAVNDEAVRYLRHLEMRISQLETENDRLNQQQKSNDSKDYRKFVVTAEPSFVGQKVSSVASDSRRLTDYPLGSVHIANGNANAMKVLSVHDQVTGSSSLKREQDDDVMDESEKAIVRQMCNVVWRKLGSAAPGYKTAV